MRHDNEQSKRSAFHSFRGNLSEFEAGFETLVAVDISVFQSIISIFVISQKLLYVFSRDLSHFLNFNIGCCLQQSSRTQNVMKISCGLNWKALCAGKGKFYQ